MDISIEDGLYVVAVSGGVDSMVLLDLLHKRPGVDLVVAHFNHGIRQDAAADEEVVSQVASKYGLRLAVGRGGLGPDASEAKAREARYSFLEAVRRKHAAKAIITAHHQDDLVETAFINILRGTGRRGLSALSSNDQLLRPLLPFPKSKLIEYAKRHSLRWREDPSNLDTKYFRNYIRHSVMPKLTDKQRSELLQNLDNIAKINYKADILIATLSQYVSVEEGVISRERFSMMPWEIGRELVVYWLRRLRVGPVDKRTVQRLTTAIKAAPAGTMHDVNANWQLAVEKSTARFRSSFQNY